MDPLRSSSAVGACYSGDILCDCSENGSFQGVICDNKETFSSSCHVFSIACAVGIVLPQ